MFRRRLPDGREAQHDKIKTGYGKNHVYMNEFMVFLMIM
jgi:hypothetical protein